MPYKTKSAKIAAAQRRFTYTQSGGNEIFSYEKGAKNKSGDHKGQEISLIGDKLYLKGDLLKILISCLVIIAFQIWLSLTLF